MTDKEFLLKYIQDLPDNVEIVTTKASYNEMNEVNIDSTGIQEIDALTYIGHVNMLYIGDD